MNKIKNLKIAPLAVLMLFVGVFFTSCDKLMDEPITPVETEQIQDENVKSSLELRSLGSMYCGIEISSGKPFTDDTHGIPNDSRYRFYVSNPTSDITRVEVVFKIPSGGEQIRTMKKNANGNFFHEQTLSQSGRYGVEYRIFRNSSSSYQKIDPKPNYVDNSKVNAQSDWISLYWVFADGSSPSNNSTFRDVVIKGKKERKQFKWLNGNQDGLGFGGYGWKEGTHEEGTSEEYALDYNLYPHSWSSGSSETLYPDIDKGSNLYSPLDGKVVQIQHNANGKFGKYVIVEQKIGDKTYQVYMGHLETISIRLNQRVIGGTTIIGTLGKTGAKGYHLHMNAWDRTRGKTSIKHFLVFKPS